MKIALKCGAKPADIHICKEIIIIIRYMALFSIVISDIKVNWLTLAFPENLEKDFIQDYRNKSLVHTRVVLLLAIFLYGIFGILDAWLVPEEKLSFWFIRFGVFIPYTAVILLFFAFQKL